MFAKIWGKLRAWTPEQRAMLVPFPGKDAAEARFASQDGRNGQIVAFHTRDKLYEAEAQRMQSSARRLGLNVAVTALEGTGIWVRNAALKPGFLLKERLSRRGPLLYVDVDAVFHNDPWPVLEQVETDIAVYYTEPDSKYDGEPVLVSATILLNDTKGTLVLLEEWKRRCEANPDIYDQKVLQEILKENIIGVTVAHLPVAFCWIFDRQTQPVETVYIEQLQASRQMKDRRLFKGRKLRRRLHRVRQIERELESS